MPVQDETILHGRFKCFRAGFLKMSENENILEYEVDDITLNEKQTNENNERRFALTTENEVDELVSNAQAQSTKQKQFTL